MTTATAAAEQNVNGAAEPKAGGKGKPKTRAVAPESAGSTLDALTKGKRVVSVALADIQPGPANDIRTRLDPQTVENYAADMQDGDVFPPITVARFTDAEGDNAPHLVCGSHRVAAALATGLRDIPAYVVECSRADGLRAALEDNRKNPLPMSLPDRKKSAALLIQAFSYRELSNNRIGHMVGLSHVTVKEIRDAIEAGKTADDIRKEDQEGRSQRAKKGHDRKKTRATGPDKPEQEALAEQGPTGDDSPDEGRWSDEKWLAEKLAPGLANLGRDRLKAARGDALRYRAMEPARKALARAFAQAGGKQALQAGQRTGRYTAMTYAFLQLAHPSRWLLCGGCDGKGCDSCHQAGYHVGKNAVKK